MDISVFAILGGDRRSAVLAELLSADGFTVYAAGFDNSPQPLSCAALTDILTAASMAQAVILPVMPTADGKYLNAPFSGGHIPLDDRLAEKLAGREVFTGFAGRVRGISPAYDALALYDYGARESFLLPNARLTAEAAVMLAIEQCPLALYDTRCIVTGYGRISKALSSMLYSLGAHVTVCARRDSDRALARSTGIAAIDFDRLPRAAETADIIFNTADALVITEETAAGLRPGTLVLDLASAPWGTDDNAVKKHGGIIKHCPGLPGKYSPLTAAKIIKDTVLSMTGGEKT